MNVITSLLELFLGLKRKQITQIAKAIQHLITLKTYNYLFCVTLCTTRTKRKDLKRHKNLSY